MKHTALIAPVLVATAVMSLGIGCATTEKPKASLSKPVATSPAPVAKAEPQKPVTDGVSVSAGAAAPSAPIYFAFDSDALTPDAQTSLQQMAAYLKSNPKASLTIEGHCDETGSEEYNLSLGDRRARAARDYLKKLGVDEVRLNSISYGEERPAVAGTDESSHAKNRRGQYDLKIVPG
jgi:peptidoglycan-associated lipoprotein